MTPEIVLAIFAFAFVMTGTPGPNNVMLMASGANFGLRRTLPHIAGIAFGVVSLILIVGLGLSQLFDAYPAAFDVLKIAALVYLLYLAWKIGAAKPPSADGPAAEARPLTALQAAAFQWVNPKAWAMALTVSTAYLPDRTLPSLMVAAAIFGLVCLPLTAIWTTLGQQMRRFLTNARRQRVFNVTMALLLVATLYPILTH
ncbi:LysE family translocator [Pelagovum pacificum]|uniref:LysE family translocator n=1 Tax=Pelagovum pacificum TaxID=2588711 RepID=A0A5C5GE62_9RHOB|nr:LysE family translocator [Pelagovum pacificum]QQA44390.1 LysE family translocator [Pelagovum pacificum]TNY32494.1 LysE family translocator [Pelagovum pacificum]